MSIAFACSIHPVTVVSDGTRRIQFGRAASISWNVVREVGRVAMGELGRRVDAGGLEQVRVLRSDPVDPHQVGMVDPFQDQLPGDPGRGLDPGAPARRRAPLQELVRGVDAGIGQLLSVFGPDALDLGDVHPGLPMDPDGRR